MKFFDVDKMLEKVVKCILAKFKLSTCCRFQDIAIQSKQFSSFFIVSILSVSCHLKKKIGDIFT